MIHAQAVRVVQPDASIPVIDDASFTIDEGDLCLVVGSTGSGKTTLLGCLNGIVPQVTGASFGGDISIAGTSIRGLRPRELADVVGYVGQNPRLSFVTEIVEDEIAYGMEQLGLSPSVMRKRVEETLDLMGIAELRRRRLLELSGGQQQRVAIAAVLAAQPRVLLLDEPTSALDPNAASDVLAAITTLVHEVGLTVVIVEHRLERVMQLADSVLWLPGDGSVVHGDAREVLAKVPTAPPLVALARHMGWEKIPLSVRQARRQLANHPTSYTETHSDSGTVGHQGETIATVDDLSVTYHDLCAVNRVSLHLERGSRVAVMGRNGSGKSSLLWGLQGAVASSGTVTVAGQDPRVLPDAQARHLVSLVPQNPADLLYLPTVGQECEQADRESEVPAGTTAAILTELGVQLPAERNPRDLSEGQRLLLVLAIQLAAKPSVVCLDEPTRGLDYTAKHHLGEIMASLSAQGICVVVATHDVEFAAATTQRTLVMADGEIIADGSTREICTSSPSLAPQVSKVFYPADVLTLDDVEPA